MLLFTDLSAWFSPELAGRASLIEQWRQNGGSLTCASKFERGEQGVDLFFSDLNPSNVQSFRGQKGYGNRVCSLSERLLAVGIQLTSPGFISASILDDQLATKEEFSVMAPGLHASVRRVKPHNALAALKQGALDDTSQTLPETKQESDTPSPETVKIPSSSRSSPIWALPSSEPARIAFSDTELHRSKRRRVDYDVNKLPSLPYQRKGTVARPISISPDSFATDSSSFSSDSEPQELLIENHRHSYSGLTSETMSDYPESPSIDQVSFPADVKIEHPWMKPPHNSFFSLQKEGRKLGSTNDSGFFESDLVENFHRYRVENANSSGSPRYESSQSSVTFSPSSDKGNWHDENIPPRRQDRNTLDVVNLLNRARQISGTNDFHQLFVEIDTSDPDFEARKKEGRSRSRSKSKAKSIKPEEK